MTKEVQKVNNALPAHLQGVGKTSKFGNTDQTDLVMPRVKLLQAISPEVIDNNDAKAGEFWHNVASASMGKVLKGIPILVRKGYVLWSPRNDDRGILARADDGLHWNLPAGTKFSVRPKGSPKDIDYTLGETVHDRVDGHPALSEFGSSIPGDANSAPAAALTYQFLWYFPDHPDMSPAVLLNTRSSVKPAKALISKIDMRPVDSYAQLYEIGVSQEKSDDGPFYNYTYTAAGYAEEADFEAAKAIYERFSGTEWRSNDENDGDADKGGGGSSRAAGPSDSSKF